MFLKNVCVSSCSFFLGGRGCQYDTARVTWEEGTSVENLSCPLACGQVRGVIPLADDHYEKAQPVVGKARPGSSPGLYLKRQAEQAMKSRPGSSTPYGLCFSLSLQKSYPDFPSRHTLSCKLK